MVKPRRFLMGIVLVLAQGLVACNSGSSPGPLAPSRIPQPPAAAQPPTVAQLVVFTDRDSGFSTSDTRDVHDQIVQFNSLGELIWIADGMRFPGYRPIMSGNSVGAEPLCECSFEVRFGIKNGERRAYLTLDTMHDNPGTVVDLEVVAGKLVATKSNEPPPGTFTLTGVIFEETSTGSMSIAGVALHVPRLSQYAESDKNGYYSIRGLSSGTISVWAGKDGYQSGSRDVTIDGDTRLDIQVVRR